ncbi:PadR family transcriptional regulator [Nocardia sp. NPDC047654]|uniref:PadR family transcriptional regulator n=1 Tax=Nocardia sp. NPDC047654 TaxID=3364314 RepID=UPI00371F707D
MPGKVRMTLQTLQVLQALLERPADEHYGLKISEHSGLPTGSIYPILTRLETAGWVTSDWEQIDESVEGRRRRRYYQLTKNGATAAREEIAKMRERLSSTRAASWQPAPRPGWGMA